jgi:hypothetical protein
MNNSHKTLADIRKDYMLKTFDEQDVLADPFEQFKLWLHEAIQSEVNEANAMTLATASANGQPQRSGTGTKPQSGPYIFLGRTGTTGAYRGNCCQG